ncbi:hypothetical protein ACP275_04G136800 [Erythranthe tilingii]
MEFWRRHKRKVYVTLGVCGSGYLLFKSYDAWRRRIGDLEKQLADDKEEGELLKAQVRTHFENIQRTLDSIILPKVMDTLDKRLASNLDLTLLLERLMQGKGQPSTLAANEKHELWDRLKCLSFTKLVSSLWSVTMLSLYLRVQVNILGRHLFITTARGLGISQLLDEAELIDKNDEEQFMDSAYYLSNYGLPALLANAEAATSEVLKGKQLKDYFNVSTLHDAIIHILDTLMIMRSPHYWVGYLMPEDYSDLSRATKFDLLMGETRAVLLSAEFANIVDISLGAVVKGVLEDVSISCGENNLMSGIPLARVIPRIAHISDSLIEEDNRSRYIQITRSIPEVELFFTLLYSSTPV